MDCDIIIIIIIKAICNAQDPLKKAANVLMWYHRNEMINKINISDVVMTASQSHKGYLLGNACDVWWHTVHLAVTACFPWSP